MYKQIKILIVVLIILSLIVNIGINKKLDHYVYLNISKSLPRGLYLVKNTAPKIGDLVIVDLPISHKNLLFKRVKSKFDGLLLKPIIAMGGDYICNEQNLMLINQNIKLSNYNTINLYSICRQLSSEELFVAIVEKANSLDSRYFGPITNKDIKAVVKPWLIF